MEKSRPEWATWAIELGSSGLQRRSANAWPKQLTPSLDIVFYLVLYLKLLSIKSDPFPNPIR